MGGSNFVVLIIWCNVVGCATLWVLGRCGMQVFVYNCKKFKFLWYLFLVVRYFWHRVVKIVGVFFIVLWDEIVMFGADFVCLFNAAAFSMLQFHKLRI